MIVSPLNDQWLASKGQVPSCLQEETSGTWRSRERITSSWLNSSEDLLKYPQLEKITKISFNLEGFTKFNNFKPTIKKNKSRCIFFPRSGVHLLHDETQNAEKVSELENQNRLYCICVQSSVCQLFTSLVVEWQDKSGKKGWTLGRQSQLSFNKDTIQDLNLDHQLHKGKDSEEGSA